MIVPVAEQTAQQVGAAQEWRVRSARAAEYDVVAAAGAGMPAVQHEFLGRQARLARGLVQKRGPLRQLTPIRGGMNIDFDDSGIRRHAEITDARIVGRLIALENDGLGQRLGSGLDRRRQFDVVLELACRRHEYVKYAVAR